MQLLAKKSLGQHFLNSPSVLAKIVEAAHISADETILEIGPGTGVLTNALLKTGARVIAVEKDDRAIDLLKQRFSNELATGKFVLHRADILETDRASFGLKNGGYAVVANIPYYITGAILESFLEYKPRPNRMILLVQKEVAERIVARDGKESILSISVKAFGTPKIIAAVPRGAFTPPPNVDSAILAIENISDIGFKKKDVPIKRFFEVLKTGFAHKRKFALRNLESVFTDKGSALKAWGNAGLNEKARAEDLTLDQWFDISSRS
jgi:16S rRNA (adenine1518-N6/adenine1519-N6)-dimethyltransferase